MFSKCKSLTEPSPFKCLTVSAKVFKVQNQKGSCTLTTTKVCLKAEASSTLGTLLITSAQSVPKNTQVLSIGKSTQAHRE